MKYELKYIELKTGFSDNGPAWIGKAEFSKSGQTIYFNGQMFKKQSGYANAYRTYSNYYDKETGDEYWISGIKKNGEDRHYWGSGKIMIDKNVVEQYLNIVELKSMDKTRFELTEIEPTDKQKFSEMENEKQK